MPIIRRTLNYRVKPSYTSGLTATSFIPFRATMPAKKEFNLIIISSYVLAAFALLVVMRAGLLAALFSGLLVYSLVHMLTPALGKNVSDHGARTIAVAILGTLIVIVLIAAIWGAISFFQSD